MGHDSLSLPQPVRFREEQRFRQLWIWLVTLPLCLGMIGFFGWAMAEQLVHGRPVGGQPMPDPLLAITGPVFILLGAGILWLMWAAHLVTEVRDDGVYIRFLPFHRDFQSFRWEEIAALEACTYRPILDYGGWGIRFGSGGKAYNVSGNRGVRLDLAAGRPKHVLIGSQRPEELAMAAMAARG